MLGWGALYAVTMNPSLSLRTTVDQWNEIPRGTELWNPTLAHKTRKDGAPGVPTLQSPNDFNETPGGTEQWNPTLAHKTRKDGAPGLVAEGLFTCLCSGA